MDKGGVFMSEITVTSDLSACESGLNLVGLKTEDPSQQWEPDVANEGVARTGTDSAISSSPPGIERRDESSTTVCHHVGSTNTLLSGGPKEQLELQQGGAGAGKRLPGKDLERRYKLCLRVEIVGLSALIVIVWGLLALPIVFYHVTDEVNENETTSTLDTFGSGMQSCDMTNKYVSVCGSIEGGAQSLTCAAPITYTESVCQQELNSIRSCLQTGDRNTHPLIVTNSDRANAELALSYVDRLASVACAAEVKPFLCVYFFGLCDSTTGASYQPTASNCKNLRDNVCATEWILATTLITLPDCESSFSDKTVSCDGNAHEDNNTDSSSGELGSGILSSTTAETPTSQSSSTVQPQASITCNNITCREGFYCIEGANICNPNCHTWNQYPRATNIAIDTLVLISASLGIIAAVGVVTVAGLRWKKVLVFPSSLVVYQTITLLIIAFFVIVNYMDSSTLNCTHKDLYQSLLETTPFCIISGVVFYYGLLQLATFWFCHVLALFWKIRFPFHSRAFQMAHRVKYVHITCVVIGIVFPALPVVATMSQAAHGTSSADAAKAGLGFGLTRFPPILCTGRHGDTTFYSLILPILLILMVGITFLLIIFWIIHRQHGLFKARQSKNPYKIGTAERKILIVFVYYVLLAVIALLAFSLTVRDSDTFTTEVLRYFECERKGIDPANPCDPSGYIMVLDVALTSMSYILLGLFPTVNFIFVINVRELKQYLEDKFPFLCKIPKRKAASFQLSDTPSSASTSSTTGMLPSTPQTPKSKKTFKF